MDISLMTLGELKKSGYQSRSIKSELRENLIENIKAGKASFTGIHGYDETVIPQLERAIQEVEKMLKENPPKFTMAICETSL